MDYRDMGMKIRTIRKEQGLTQDQLAERLKISASFLGHLERGTRVASIDTLAALCNVLQVSPGYLMESAFINQVLTLPHSLTEEETRQLNALTSFYLNQLRSRPAGK